MKKVVKITQSKLAELLMREAGGNAWGEGGAFNGGSFKVTHPEFNDKQEQTIRKVNVEFTEEEITFIEDVLDGVQPDNENEKELIFNITQKLRNNLIKR